MNETKKQTNKHTPENLTLHVEQNRHPTTNGEPWGALVAVPHPAGGAGSYPSGMTMTWRGANGRASGERIAACVNALAGLNPEAVKDVVEALEDVAAEIDLSQEWWLDGRLKGDAIRAALAKLKGAS